LAKSGTSDDIIRPFNVDASSAKRTNYCMWNAVLRVDLAKLPGSPLRGGGSEVKDITVACIGEGNQQYTGSRDGKSLHKFLTAGLLKIAGVKAPNGYFTQYENYLRRLPPDLTNCGIAPEPEPEDEDPPPPPSRPSGGDDANTSGGDDDGAGELENW
jgi:hypothetical protein